MSCTDLHRSHYSHDMQYFDEFNHHAADNDVADVPWIEITTSDGPSVVDDLRQNASSGDPSPMPFRNWTIPEIYEFYKAHLRPAPDGSGTKHFTSFTFFVVDEECVQSDIPKSIVCSDAPDFGESDEVELKYFRIPIAEVMPSMAALEMLSMTPSEVRDQSEFCLKVFPQPMLVSDPDNPNTYQLATPQEGRANKRAGIRMAEGLERSASRTAEFRNAAGSRDNDG